MDTEGSGSSQVNSPSFDLSSEWDVGDFSTEEALALISDEDFTLGKSFEQTQKKRKIGNPTFSWKSYYRSNVQYYGLYNQNFENL